MIKGFLGLALAAGVMAAPAAAVISGGTLVAGSAFTNGGIFVNLGNPAAFAIGADTTNSSNVFGINEKQMFTLTRTLLTNLGGNIAAGQTIRSHVISFDPLGFTQTAIGTVSFNTKVLAVIYSGGRMVASNYLGNPNVTYTTPSAFALEATDNVSFSGNTVSYNLLNGVSSDNFRVITQGVPEPAAWALLIIGFGLVGAAARRRGQVAVAA